MGREGCARALLPAIRVLHLEEEIDVRRHVRTQQPRRLQLPPVQIWRSNRPSPTKGASICKHTGIVK